MAQQGLHAKAARATGHPFFEHELAGVDIQRSHFNAVAIGPHAPQRAHCGHGRLANAVTRQHAIKTQQGVRKRQALGNGRDGADQLFGLDLFDQLGLPLFGWLGRARVLARAARVGARAWAGVGVLLNDLDRLCILDRRTARAVATHGVCARFGASVVTALPANASQARSLALAALGQAARERHMQTAQLDKDLTTRVVHRAQHLANGRARDQGCVQHHLALPVIAQAHGKSSNRRPNHLAAAAGCAAKPSAA